jgi:hypothetical protein
MSLVAVNIKLRLLEESLLYQDAAGDYWLSCVCIHESDAKGRKIVVQSVSKERRAQGEKGPSVGFWREIGTNFTKQAEAKQFDLSKYQKPAERLHPSGPEDS